MSCRLASSSSIIQGGRALCENIVLLIWLVLCSFFCATDNYRHSDDDHYRNGATVPRTEGDSGIVAVITRTCQVHCHVAGALPKENRRCTERRSVCLSHLFFFAFSTQLFPWLRFVVYCSEAAAAQAKPLRVFSPFGNTRPYESPSRPSQSGAASDQAGPAEPVTPPQKARHHIFLMIWFISYCSKLAVTCFFDCCCCCCRW